MAAITLKCPNCGGGLVFNPDTQKYKCEYCMSDFGLEELEEKEPPAPAAAPEKAAREREEGDMVGYTCPSCGAEIVTDATTAASFCYYCHNPVVMEGRLEGSYHPDYVIPFAIDREKAKEIFSQWIRRKRFVPGAFYSNKQIESMTGVYFPYWLYSCRVDGRLDAEGTKLRIWESGNLRYTEHKTYHISRGGRMEVQHVSRNALKKANGKLADGVLPFQPEGLKPFQIGYLTGFMAEKRDLEQEALAAALEAEVKNFAESSLKNSAGGYTSLKVRQQSADLKNVTWHYSLFPVWTMTYRGPRDGKIYYFALNGQTGKICGELPVDSGKLAVFFLLVFLPLLLLLLAGGYFL